MSSHLPRDSTDSTSWPARGVSSLKRVSSGYVERKPVTGLPMSARPMERAVRKMVSPSGIEHFSFCSKSKTWIFSADFLKKSAPRTMRRGRKSKEKCSGLLDSTCELVVMRHGERKTAQVHSEGARIKTGVHQKASHGMRSDRLS